MRKYLILLFMTLFCISNIFAADISISSEVDKKEVELGDTIRLTVTIKKPTERSQTQSFGNGGFSFSFNSMNFNSMGDIDFDIDNIPGFNIEGRSQSSQSRIFNGVGETVKSIVLSLVPQKEGELTIPAFSMKDKDGKEHQSNPIKIKVNKISGEPDEDEKEDTASSTDNTNNNYEDSDNNENEEEKKDSLLFNILFGVGVFIIIFVIIVIIFAYFMNTHVINRNNKDNKIEDAVIVEDNTSKGKVANKQEDISSKPELEKIDFASKYSLLKLKYKEVSPEFYNQVFDLFKNACSSKNTSLSNDMTFDELLNKICDLAGTDNIKQATKRVSYDIEMVMYANRMPDRKLNDIEIDLKEIINSI